MKSIQYKEKPRCMFFPGAFVLMVVLLQLSLYLDSGATEFLGPDPGVAEIDSNNNQYTLSNNVIEATFQLSNNNLILATLKDKIHNSVNYLQVGELFRLTVSGGTTIVDSDMSAGTPATEKINGDPQSLRVRERYNGWKVTVPFTYSSGGKELSLTWSAILRDGSNYINQEIVYTATTGEWDIDRIYMIDITGSGAEVVGIRDGSPIFAGQFFFAQETPVAKSSVSNGTASAYFPREEITKEGESFSQGSVIGIYPYDQKRRGFQYYLERERIREHYAFLHYNTWWDINGSAVNQTNIINRINAFGQELVVERGVNLKGYLVDDGYDDLNYNSASTIWELQPSQFPNGISPLNSAAANYSCNMGFWMSPGGGYGGLNERVQIARKVNPNVETHSDGTLKVSGPNYYPIFKAAVFKKMDSDVQSFKFDRITGSEDVYAVARLSREMRDRNGNVFINATVGTWGSPFFFWFFDSVWRQGADALGQADATRDEQVTYRDMEAHKITTNNPMMPLNSLMVHGIGHGQSYQGKSYSHDTYGNPLDMNDPVNLQDFREEVRNYFSQGFNLQELYITPGLMTEGCWDVLAEAAKWGHANHDVLLDAHFIGGSPGQDEVYGVASWSRTKAILMFRNPATQTKSISLNPDSAFDIPDNYSYIGYTLIDPFDSTTIPLPFNKGQNRTFTIPSESILLYEAIPDVTPITGGSGLPSGMLKIKILVNNNAVNKAIRIIFNSKIEKADVSLVSVNGRVIAQNTGMNIRQVLLNTGSISKGIYFIKVIIKNNTFVRKICITE